MPLTSVSDFRESRYIFDMANPAHRSVLLDHQMIVDGVLMQEKKYLTRTLNDETGLEESHLSHMRVIGERSYSLKQSIIDEDEKEVLIETVMNNDKLEKFKNEWEEKWIPSIREDESGILSWHSRQIFEDVPKEELQKKSTTRFEEVGTIDMAELPKDFMTCTACGYVTDLKKVRKIQ